MKLYKVLNNNQSCIAGSFNWTPYLPHDGIPGKWTPKIFDPEICRSGYHGTSAEYLLHYVYGNQLFECEAENATWNNDIFGSSDKFTSSRMRLVRRVESYNDKNLRLFAVWCAREAIKHLSVGVEKCNALCDRAEKYANGLVDNTEFVRTELHTRTVFKIYDEPLSTRNSAEASIQLSVIYTASFDAYAAANQASMYAAMGIAEMTGDFNVRAVTREKQARQLIKMLGLEE